MESKKLAISLLKIAQTDTKASLLLYEHCLYMQAIFYLQQSIEKTSKALGVEAEIIQPNQLKSFGHNQPGIIERTLDHQFDKLTPLANNPMSVALANKFIDGIARFRLEDYLADIGAVKDSLKNIGKLDFISIREEELLKIIMELENMDEYKCDLNEQQIADCFDSVVETLWSRIKSAGAPISPDELKQLRNNKAINDAIKQFSISIISLTSIWQQINSLGLLYYGLVSRVRYPFPAQGFNPLDVFIQELPIVKHHMRICMLVQKSIGRALEIFCRDVC